MKKRAGMFSTIAIAIVLAVGAASHAAGETVGIYYRLDTPQHEFAAGDVKAALEAGNFTVEMRDLSTLKNRDPGKKVVIASASDAEVIKRLNESDGSSVPELGEQAYAIRTTTLPQLNYWVLGGDENGAMYGGLQLAEYIRFSGLSRTVNEEESPHLKNRGIKFNIPLDKEAPTYFYNSSGTSHKEAIRHVWDMEFWTTWFDEMARHRYNVLSLWSPHPFTSMVNMEDEYPGIAIQGVTGFDGQGRPVKINEMTIGEKIAFWQEVMKYGRDRGFSIYILTWNIFLSTAEGMHGLTHKPDDPETRAYLRQCVKGLLDTYPDLAGIGVTVGERMGELDASGKEEWAWDTYGRGMLEYAETHPERELVFIHRQHQGNLDNILDYFKPLSELPNVRFDLSFKYSQAHAHTTVTPAKWHRAGMKEGLKAHGLKSWLTVRNDDFYFLHWADPGFVRDYINHFPAVDELVNTFYIGPDGWVFTRVFANKDPYYEQTNALSIQKTWYMQKLWGRIAYNPAVPDELFKQHLAFRYPEVPVESLFEAWSKASDAVRLANEQVTGAWDLDFKWWPEGWTGKGADGPPRYLTLQDTRTATPYKGSTLCSFADTAKGRCGDKTSAWITADRIETQAQSALDTLAGFGSVDDVELKLNLNDIAAMSYLGLYNAHKFRAAMFLEQDQQEAARDAAGKAYGYWKKYTHLMAAMYKPVELQRNRSFSSWHEHDQQVLQDYLDLGGSGFDGEP